MLCILACNSVRTTNETAIQNAEVMIIENQNDCHDSSSDVCIDVTANYDYSQDVCHDPSLNVCVDTTVSYDYSQDVCK